jgi:SHS2 domain-containing protein
VSPARSETDAGYEIIEHTADLGVRAWGTTLEAAFEQAAWALVDLLDVRSTGKGTRRRLTLTGADAGSLLVDFLNELVFFCETEEVAVSDVTVRRVSDAELDAELSLGPLTGRPEGVVVKAATYHRLRVARDGGRTEVRVFLDV